MAKENRIDTIRKKKLESKMRSSRSYLFVDTAKLERMGITQFKSSDGDNFLYIVPPQDPTAYYAREIHVHRDVGVNGLTYLCPNKMFNKPCPICEERARLRKSDPSSEKIKACSTGLRFLFFVVDTKDRETTKKGLRWYDSPATVEEELGKVCEDKRTHRIIDVSDPEEPHEVIFERTGTGLTTSYGGFQLKPLDIDIKKDWLDVPVFEDVLKKVDYEVIEAEFKGLTDVDEGDDENERPRGRRDRDRDEEEPRRRDKDEEEEPRRRRDKDEDEKSRGRRDEEEKPRGRRDEDEGNGVTERVRSRLRDEDEEEKPRGRRDKDEGENKNEKSRRRRPIEDE